MKRQRNKDILPKKLKPECGASSQRCNANKGNRETILFCLLLVSNLSLQILRVTLSCHNTMDSNRTSTLRGTENTPDLDAASRDYSGSITYWFKCGLRGFHVYKEAWSPIVGEQLKCCYERNNCYDRYAIAATKRLRGRLIDSAVGHLPEEISRATRFFLLRRVIVCGKVIGKNHRGSPLVQGGLEIPLQGTAEMDPKGTRQYLKTINRLSFQIIKNPG